jgi:hypothetical protein
MGKDRDRLLSQREAADFYQVSPRCFYNWRKRHLLPKPSVVLPNGRYQWYESVLRATLKSTPPSKQTVAAPHSKAQVDARPGQAA